jgi:hypothetical protein
MSEQPNKEAILDVAIARTKLECFNNPADEQDTEALGVLISQWSKWNGQKIIEAFLSALEDANYATLNRQIRELWEKQQAETKEIHQRMADANLDRLLLKQRIEGIWKAFTEQQKLCVRIGMIPQEAYQQVKAEGIGPQELAVGLMDCATKDGGMFA